MRTDTEFAEYQGPLPDLGCLAFACFFALPEEFR
jgi:hypothetical protein